MTSLYGFSGTASLTMSAPPELIADLGSSSLTVTPEGTDSTTLSITAPSTTSTGTYPVTITAVSGSLIHSTTVTVVVIPRVPSAPKNLAGTAGNTQVTLSWSAPSDSGTAPITNYKVYRGTSAGEETLLATIGDVLTYTDTAVTCGQTYYYQVTAVNSGGESSRSNEAMIIIPVNLVVRVPQAPPEGVTILIDGLQYQAYADTPATAFVTPGQHTIQAPTTFEKEEWQPGQYYIYTFKNWSDGLTANPRTSNITSDTTLTANYLRSKYPYLKTIP
jgi:hypothetical protein